MKNLTLHFAAVGLSFLALSPASAAFDPAVVAADAHWVVFLDVNDLRASALGQQLIDAAQKQVQIGLANSDIHFDFQKTLATIESVTAYGANFSSDPKMLDGTLLIRGTAELR